MEGTVLSYASTALQVGIGANAELRGKVTHSTLGLDADGYADATGVDWGSSTGPAPLGTGVPVSGNGAIVIPWVGYVAPPRPPTAPAQPKATASTCKDIAFVGMRGSSETPQGTALDSLTADQMDSRLFGSYVASIFTEFDRLDSRTIKAVGIAYPALPAPLKTHINAFADSAYDGVDKLYDILLDEHAKCPSQKYVLAGYSQGALAVHETLRLISPTSTLASKIAGVALLADPGRVSMAEEDTYTTAASEPVFITREGSWAKIMLGNPATTGPIPDWLLARTISMCHDKDIVCAPGWGASTSEHTNYTSAELNFFAEKLRDRSMTSQP